MKIKDHLITRAFAVGACVAVATYVFVSIVVAYPIATIPLLFGVTGGVLYCIFNINI